MNPDDAARIHQVARVLAEGGASADALRFILRLALGPVPLPAVVVTPPRLGDVSEPDEVRALREFAARWPAIMNGWFKG